MGLIWRIGINIAKMNLAFKMSPSWTRNEWSPNLNTVFIRYQGSSVANNWVSSSQSALKKPLFPNLVFRSTNISYIYTTYSIDEVITSLKACSDWPPTTSRDWCSFLVPRSTTAASTPAPPPDPPLLMLLLLASPEQGKKKKKKIQRNGKWWQRW